MFAGLLLVHGITRWSVSLSQLTINLPDAATSLNSSTDPHVIVRLLNTGLDHIVFMVTLAALIIKYVLFVSHGQLEESLTQDNLNHPQDTSATISTKASLKTLLASPRPTQPLPDESRLSQLHTASSKTTPASPSPKYL